MFKKSLQTAALGAALLLMTATSHAAVQQGDWELGFSGSYSALDAGGADLDLLLLDGKAGYFVTSGLQVSSSLTYLDAEIEGDSLDAIMVGGGADYHFNTQSTFVPFVGAGISWVDVDVGGLGGGDDFAWEVRAGAKQFVAENVAIKYQVSYLEFDDLDLDGVNVNIGLSFFF